MNFLKGGVVVEKNKEVGSNIKTPSTRWKVAKNLPLFTTTLSPYIMQHVYAQFFKGGGGEHPIFLKGGGAGVVEKTGM